MPNRSHKVLPLSEKVKVLNLVRKEKRMLRLLRSMVQDTLTDHIHILFITVYCYNFPVLLNSYCA